MPLVGCLICKTEFYIKPSHQLIGWGKYCSMKCRSKAQCKGRVVKCYICKKEVYRSPKSIKRSVSGKFFCTKSCQTLWRNREYIGDKNKNWKKGESAYRNILKRTGKRPICSLCGIKNEKLLNAHHIDHNRENNTISNLKWLCLNCHYLVHHDKTIEEKISKT